MAAAAGEDSSPSALAEHPHQQPFNHESRETHLYFKRIQKNEARGMRAMDVAREESGRRGTLAIWAADVPNPHNDPKRIGVKFFVVASYRSFLDHYQSLGVNDRFYYEIARVLPTRFYVDVDVERAENVDITQEVFIHKRDLLIGSVRKELALLAGLDPNDVTNAEGNIGEVLILDSTRPAKFSQHLVFPNAVLRNPFHCGAFMRRIRYNVTCEYQTSGGIEDSKEDHPFYIWSRVKDRSVSGETKRVRGFFADMMVYTFDRNFRLLGSRKNFDGALPLREEGATSKDIDPVIFNKSLLQRIPLGAQVYDVPELDGSMPVSTNDETLFRYGVNSAPGRLMKAARPTPATRCQPETACMGTRPVISDQKLRFFWQNTYPFDILWALTKATARRDFHFVNAKGIWLRPRNFDTMEELRVDALEQLPQQIHVGPERADTHMSNPSLTLDIDIHDYAKYRPCCGDEGKACATCWPIMIFAQKALSAYFEEIGLGTPLFFFSGSKGIHVWFPPTNEQATKIALSEPARGALLNDLSSFWQPGSGHPENTESGAATGSEPVIPAYPALTHRTCVEMSIGTERDKWIAFLCDTMDLKTEFDRHTHVYGNPDSAIVHCLWPRLDIVVTRDITHAVKAPFCLHPRTGKCARWLPDPSANPFADPTFEEETTACIPSLRERLAL